MMIMKEPYGQTIEGNDFLRVDEEDMKMFAADNDLQFLAQSNHWFADGTFHVTPDDFSRMYTIYGFYDDHVFPCVCALLPGRGEDT